MQPTTEQMTQGYSDYYKEAYGFRPSVTQYERWDNATDEEKQRIWDGLCNTMESRWAEIEAIETSNHRDFNAAIARIMTIGAPNRRTAIKWFLQAEGLHKENDPNYICYSLGISYDYAHMFRPFVSNVFFKEAA